MTLAVLRAEPGNSATCARIRAAGHQPLALPLFEVAPLGWTPPDPARFDALLLTSANAARHAGPRLSHLAALPLLTVGAATARAAQAAGLHPALIGTGDASDLIAAAQAAGYRRLLHLGAAETTVTTGGAVVASLAVYAAHPRDPGGEALAALAGTTVLIHSARAGEWLARRVDGAGLARETIALAAISAAAAAAAGAGWARVALSPRPDDASLIEIATAIDPPGRGADKRA